MKLIVAENELVASTRMEVFDTNSTIIVLSDEIEHKINSVRWTEFYVLVGNGKDAMANILVRKEMNETHEITREQIEKEMCLLRKQRFELNVPKRRIGRRIKRLNFWRSKRHSKKEKYNALQILYSKQKQPSK